MAMTVRLPAELDAALERLADARRTSKHAVLIEAAERFTRDEELTSRVLDAVQHIGVQYGGTLRRLEDA